MNPQNIYSFASVTQVVVYNGNGSLLNSQPSFGMSSNAPVKSRKAAAKETMEEGTEASIQQY